uniref:Uncharacterized protein n=1 Tax=Anguilla anguilla TaxID=7936 RepID=A0A0E9TKE2_ANGAN
MLSISVRLTGAVDPSVAELVNTT